jgi:hypothetical protein
MLTSFWWASEYLDPPYKIDVILVGLGVPRPTLLDSTHKTTASVRRRVPLRQEPHHLERPVGLPSS